MKTELTIEQSAHLIELGVDPKLASKCRVEHKSDGLTYFKVVDHDEYCYEIADLNPKPIFSLTDILAILPKEIKAVKTADGDDYISSQLRIWWMPGVDEWWCGYDCLIRVAAPELIDALHQLLVWCIKDNHYNPKKEEANDLKTT